jgi:hypothetical protein
MTDKNKLLLTVAILSPLLSGLYGILLDQLSYSISSEYFTKFRFYQFQIASYFHYRIGVAIVGFLSTWWVGLLIGTAICLFSLIQNNVRSMKEAIVKGLTLALFITILTPLLGILISVIPTYLNSVEIEMFSIIMPSFVPQHEKIEDPFAFYVVWLVKYYSCLGVLIGFLGALILNVRIRIKSKHEWK